MDDCGMRSVGTRVHPPSDTIAAALVVAFRWGEQLAAICCYPPKPILRDAEGKPTHAVTGNHQEPTRANRQGASLSARAPGEDVLWRRLSS